MFAAHRRRFAISALIGLAALLAAGGAAWAAARAIAAPIRNLGAVATRIAEGDLEARATQAGSRELRGVAREFNRVLDARGRSETVCIAQSIRRQDPGDHHDRTDIDHRSGAP